MTGKTLFVKVGGDYQWTENQIDNLVEEIDGVLPDEISVIAVPDDVKYLTPEQVEDFADEIKEAVESDD